jgi:tRNA-dihydrouridine synthase C
MSVPIVVPIPIPISIAMPSAAPRFVLAPMEGLLDARLRAVITRATRYDWCVTEFVRVTNTRLPRRCYTRIAPELHTASRTRAGTPVRVQLLGSDPACMADNAARLASLDPAGIDLNFGCPAPIVNRHGGGAILLDDPALLDRIVAQVTKAVAGRVPVTVKMRLGVRDKSRALEAAQALAGAGAQMLVVHARTKDEGYRAPAHWEWVARIADAVQLPVIANGEIWTVDDYLRCRAASGQRDVMLGRGAVADPFLVERIRDRLAGRSVRAPHADWARVLPLLFDYWASVRREVTPKHAPGRLKLWLNLLRRNYPQAEILFQRLKPLRDANVIDLHLQSITAAAA